MLARAPKFRRKARATRPYAMRSARSRTPAVRESPMDPITTQPQRHAHENPSGPRQFGCARSRANANPTCSAVSRSVFSDQPDREHLGSPSHVGNKNPPQRKASRESARNIEHEVAINQRRPRRTRNDRTPIGPRERIPPGPPHWIGRCSIVGRSPDFVTRIISSIVIPSPRLSQPGRTRACHSGTARCSWETRPPQHGCDAGKCLTDREQDRNGISQENLFRSPGYE